MIFHETTPPGFLGALRFVAFGCVVVGAAVVARREGAPEHEADGPAPAELIVLRRPIFPRRHRSEYIAPIGFAPT